MKRSSSGPRRANRHLWLVEPLQELEAFEQRSMFGALACYLNELIVVVLADKEEPWSGVLFPVERENHGSILEEFPRLSPHPILPKWLYLPESAESFEEDAARIVTCIRRLDPRFGVVPPKRRGKKR